MTLEQWANNGWLRPHQTSPKEIRDLLAIVKRDLTDASGDISADWQFGTFNYPQVSMRTKNSLRIKCTNLATCDG